MVLNDVLKQRNVHQNNFEDLGDGDKLKIFKCKSTRCGLKNQFIARDKTISTCSKRIYDCITLPGTIYVDCHSANLIYLLTCCTCGLQYVEETV